TTREFPTLSALGQTTITLNGAMIVTIGIWLGAALLNIGGTQIGAMDTDSILMLLFFALASQAFAQFLWIWGAGGLGILLASFHTNAVPFYVMVVLVVGFDQPWNWVQADGAALIAIGVIISQLPTRQHG
ncbi:MAG: EamA/RhaT family transporter, partial [Pseudomonadota bacterium]